MKDDRKRSWLKGWKETPVEDTYVSGLEPKEQYTPYFDLGVDINQETSVSTGPSQDARDVSCIDSNGCAAGWACRGGFCVQNNTDDNSTSGGCGSGGTGTFLPGDDFGCIEISGGAGGGGGCTTGTCGSDGSGGAGGGAEYCCGDWVCEKDLKTGELECKCVYVDPNACGSDEDCPEGYTCVDGYCFFDYCDCESDSDCPEDYTCSGCFCLYDYDFEECANDADCPEGYECVGGFCYPDYGCQNDAECPEGETCFGGFCTTTCKADGDCNDGEFCLDGYCFPGCRKDTECPDGEICYNNYCIPGCREDGYCPDGEVCYNNFCIPGCNEDSDCLVGEVCLDGFCTENCVVNGDCPEGEICSNGFCFPGCEFSSDCEEGEICSNGFCFPGCDVSSDCPDGEICYGGFCLPGCDEESSCPSELQCINGFCSGSCTDDAECPDGQICLGGWCLNGCRSNEDCPEGYECSNGFCLPVFEFCEGDYNCNSQEQCINGFCFPGPPTCSTEGLEGCLPNEYCLDGFCVPNEELPDCGLLDITDCAALEAAKQNPNCNYTVETSGYFGECGDGLVGCYQKDESGKYTGEIVWTPNLSYANSGQTFAWAGSVANGYWKDTNCDRNGGVGGSGGGGGGGPTPPSPPGDATPCNNRCQERTEAGVAGEECDGVPICKDCEQCNSKGRCEKFEPGTGPCWCENGEDCLGCEKCDKEDGGCVPALEQCQECCTTFVDCPCGESIQGTCCYPLELGSKTFDFTCINKCRVSLFEQCRLPEDCDPPGPEPCDCNCEEDCPECYICNEAGKCEPSEEPECQPVPPCCGDSPPPGSKCVKEQQITIYRSSGAGFYPFQSFRTNGGGWSVSENTNGFYDVNFTSSCGEAVTASGVPLSDEIDVRPSTGVSETCAPCDCERYQSGGSPAYC